MQTALKHTVKSTLSSCHTAFVADIFGGVTWFYVAVS